MAETIDILVTSDIMRKTVEVCSDDVLATAFDKAGILVNPAHQFALNGEVLMYYEINTKHFSDFWLGNRCVLSCYSKAAAVETNDEATSARAKAAHKEPNKNILISLLDALMTALCVVLLFVLPSTQNASIGLAIASYVSGGYLSLYAMILLLKVGVLIYEKVTGKELTRPDIARHKN